MPQNLQTVGYAAALYQRDPRAIENALTAVQVKSPAEAALTLNGLRYFSADDIAAAIGWIAEHAARHAAKKVLADA